MVQIFVIWKSTRKELLLSYKNTSVDEELFKRGEYTRSEPLTEGTFQKGGLNKKPTRPRPIEGPSAMFPIKEDDNAITLSAVAKLLKTSLVIRLLRGDKYVWQVKLEKVQFLDKEDTMRWASIKNGNPNYAILKLCETLSYKKVIGPKYREGIKKRIKSLSLVKKGHLYVRIEDERGLV